MKTYNIEQVDEYFSLMEMDKSPHTIVSYQGSIDKLFKFLNIKNFEDVKNITARDIRTYQSELQKGNMSRKNKKMSRASVNTNTRPIRAMFNWLIENEYLKKSPLEKVKSLKEGKKVVAFLSEEEESKIISVCKNDQDRLIFAIMILAGLRRDEVCSLNVSSFDGTHILVEGKGDKERKLRLLPEVIELLNKHIVVRNKKYGSTTDALFVTKGGKHYTGDAIYKKIKSIVQLAGLSEERIKAIHPHTARHTFCTNMLEITSLPQVQFAMGHSRSETTMRYSHVRNTAIDSSMLKQKSIL